MRSSKTDENSRRPRQDSGNSARTSLSSASPARSLSERRGRDQRCQPSPGRPRGYRRSHASTMQGSPPISSCWTVMESSAPAELLTPTTLIRPKMPPGCAEHWTRCSTVALPIPRRRLQLDALSSGERERVAQKACAKARWWRCHRRLVADALIRRYSCRVHSPYESQRWRSSALPQRRLRAAAPGKPERRGQGQGDHEVTA
jgi:hypothetical protein